MKEFVDGLDGVHSTSLNLASLPLLKLMSYMYLLQIWLVSNGQLQCFLRACLHGGGVTPGGGGGGRELPYKKGRGARWKLYIKPLKETNLGVAQAFFDP